MTPTYEDGQYTLMQRSRSLKDNWQPERFDVIVIWSDEHQTKLIKRVVGLPGEKVEIKDGIIYIDGKKLYDTFGKGKMIYRQLMDPTTNEPWWTEYENIKPIIVEPGHIWVIGDNREDSVFGHFPVKDIYGKIETDHS